MMFECECMRCTYNVHHFSSKFTLTPYHSTHNLLKHRYKVFRAEDEFHVFRDFENYVKREHQRITFEANGDTDIKCAARDGDLDRLNDILEDIICSESTELSIQLEMFTALRVACHHSQLHVVQHLISRIHPRTIRGERGLLLLIHAILGDGSQRNWLDRAKIVDLLLCRSNDKLICHLKDDKDTSALYRAATIGHVEIVKMLIEHGADVNAMNSGTAGYTALFIASNHGHLDVTRTLLEAGANPKTRCNGCPTLVVSAHNGHVEIVRMLLQSGADPNCSDRGGCSGLYMACLRGHTDVISLLLSRGASVNMQTNEGATGLAIASQMGYRDIVALLLSQENIDVNLAGKRQGTPLVRSVRLDWFSRKSLENNIFSL